mmetsp:Transcript_2872/g.3378  ORF Transcript_2872/g.3378 Transcript_2872/m.3378 type:complete len:274 (+) Transcript_2872:164-985(+)
MKFLYSIMFLILMKCHHVSSFATPTSLSHTQDINKISYHNSFMNINSHGTPNSKKQTKSSLQMISNLSFASYIPWVTSTILGGSISTPLVLKATKTWYKSIPLPSYTPPNAIFGPVWTILYTFMGIGSCRIYTLTTTTTTILADTTTSSAMFLLLPRLQKNIMKLSYLHFLLNIVWAPIFFGLKRLRLGHVLNVLILLSLVPVIIGYMSLDYVSGLLLVPYLIWLAFAVRLSSGICHLNPTNFKGSRRRLFNNALLENEIWKLREEAGKKVGL